MDDPGERSESIECVSVATDLCLCKAAATRSMQRRGGDKLKEVYDKERKRGMSS
jgi:hypothetical protein